MIPVSEMFWRVPKMLELVLASTTDYAPIWFNILYLLEMGNSLVLNQYSLTKSIQKFFLFLLMVTKRLRRNLVTEKNPCNSFFINVGSLFRGTWGYCTHTHTCIHRAVLLYSHTPALPGRMVGAATLFRSCPWHNTEPHWLQKWFSFNTHMVYLWT